jgi:hypothetical protein
MVGGVVSVAMKKGILGTCSQREKGKRIKYEVILDGNLLTISRFQAKRRNTHRYNLQARCLLRKLD